MRLKRFTVAVLVALGLCVAIPVVPQAQSTVTAQILSFWRLLKVGGSFSGEQLSYSTLSILPNGYANFGTTLGTAGYGIRDNAGTIEFKNSGGSWAAASGGATPTATFLVQTATGAPVNAQILSALGSGLVFNTTTTGVQSIYAGTSCTAQFPRSLSAAGAATCASVNLAADTTGVLVAAGFPALTGDVTTTAGSLATTLASVTSAVSRGSATSIPTFTVDVKGRLTATGAATPQLTLTSTYFSSLSAASLTGVPTSALSGALPAANFPAMTGDVTNTAGSLATVVGKIGGQTVSLGGAFTTSGANSLTITTTGATALTFPTSGTLVSSTVTSLPSLAVVGTLTTGVWNGTPVTPVYGGTGLATITLHALMVGEGTSTVFPLAGCTNGVAWWALSSTDPTCATSPLLTSPGFTASTILGGTGLAGGATTNTSITKVVTGIADGVATPVVTVTVPNAGEAAVVHVRVLGSLGAGGAIGAYECSATFDGNVSVARTTGVATVPTAATAAITANSCVAGATTLTLAYSLSGNTGATGATQTFAIQVTLTKGGGSSANHQAVVFAEVLNAVASGVTVS